jgi:LysR family cyn operon transcriptional activator
LKATPGQREGSLKIGSTFTFNVNFVPSSVAAFLRRYPTVSVTVLELPVDEVEEQLDQEKIDLGIAYRPALQPGLIFEPLYIDEMVLAVGVDHPFAARKRMRLVELHRQELVMQTETSDTRHILDGNFKSVGAEPIIVAEMNGAAAMISLVQELNIGAIVSRHFAGLFPGVCFIPLESPTPLRTAGILSKSDRPKSLACHSFISEIRNAIIEANMHVRRKGQGTSVPTPFACDSDDGVRSDRLTSVKPLAELTGSPRE